MSYQPFGIGRVSFAHVPVQAPIVNRDLVRPRAAPAPTLPAARKLRDKVSADLIAQMRALRAEGHSNREVGRRLTVDKLTVAKYTSDIQPPPSGWLKGPPRLSRFNLPFAQRLQRSGFTYAEIAEELKCSEGTAWNLLNPEKKSVKRSTAEPISKLLRPISRIIGIPCGDLRADRTERNGRSVAEIAKARHIVFWALVRRHGLSLNKAAISLYGFDHTTVRHGVLRVEGVIKALGIDPTVSVGRVASALWKAEWPKVACR